MRRLQQLARLCVHNQQQLPLPAWLQCVSGLRALHSVAAAAAAGRLTPPASCSAQQQQHHSSSSSQAFSTDTKGPLEQQQQQRHHDDNASDSTLSGLRANLSQKLQQHSPSQTAGVGVLSLEHQLQQLKVQQEQQLESLTRRLQQQQQEHQQGRGNNYTAPHPRPRKQPGLEGSNAGVVTAADPLLLHHTDLAEDDDPLQWLSDYDNSSQRQQQQRLQIGKHSHQHQGRLAAVNSNSLSAASIHPLNSFLQLGVDRQLVKALSVMNMHTPTPVQEDAFAAVLTGRNISLQSPTGTGKTLAYLLPLLHRLQPRQDGRLSRSKFPRVLVVCPTQELCMQVLRTARSLVPSVKGLAYPVVGGSSVTKQAEAWKRHGPFVLTATPGRLLKVISKRRDLLVKPILRPRGVGAAAAGSGAGGGSGLTHDMPGSVTLVLEEADRLCAMDDFKSLLPWLSPLQQHSLSAALNPPDLTQHMRSILNTYQVVLVSASLRPGALQSAQAWVDTSPLNIRSEAPWAATPASRAAAAAQAAAAQAAAGGLGAGGASVSDVDGDKHLSSSDASRQQQGGDGGDGGVQQESTGTEAETARQRWAKMLPDTISHQVLCYDERQHGGMFPTLSRLVRLFAGQGKKVLMFVRPADTPLRVAKVLQAELKQTGIQVGALYGDQTGPLRASTLAAFDRGALCCLVTSDAFALGLDYRDVDVVVNLEALAPTAALYVARAGRTGRMGRPGTVLALLPQDKLRAHRVQLKKVVSDIQVMELARQGRGSSSRDVLQPKIAVALPPAATTAGTGGSSNSRSSSSSSSSGDGASARGTWEASGPSNQQQQRGRHRMQGGGQPAASGRWPSGSGSRGGDRSPSSNAAAASAEVDEDDASEVPLSGSSSSSSSTEGDRLVLIRQRIKKQQERARQLAAAAAEKAARLE